MTFHFTPCLWFDDWGMEITERFAVTETDVETITNYPRQFFLQSL